VFLLTYLPTYLQKMPAKLSTLYFLPPALILTSFAAEFKPAYRNERYLKFVRLFEYSFNENPNFVLTET
jgi:hypothetical protein